MTRFDDGIKKVLSLGKLKRSTCMRFYKVGGAEYSLLTNKDPFIPSRFMAGENSIAPQKLCLRKLTLTFVHVVVKIESATMMGEELKNRESR